MVDRRKNGLDELRDKFEEHHKQFDCKHTDTALRKRTLSNNKSFHYIQQCLNCGKQVGTPIKRELALQQCEGQEPPSYDENLRDGWLELVKQEHDQLVGDYEDKKARVSAEFWKEYDVYVLTPAWQAIREKVLKRAKGICEGCAVRPASQAHHLTYKHFLHEFLFELAAVCKDCHDRLHAEHVKKLEDPRKF